MIILVLTLNNSNIIEVKTEKYDKLQTKLHEVM